MPQTDQTESQPTHHYILTLQAQDEPGGLDVVTFNAAVTPPQGWTRAEFYRGLYADLTKRHPHLAKAQTIFFSLEPNQL